MSLTPEEYMELAISKAVEGIEEGETPFGACIIDPFGEIVVCEHNGVWSTGDPTAHAEMVTIRSACKKINSIVLVGHTLYTTCEPCPMCYSAAHWSRISFIVYGAEIADAKAAGFNELVISAQTMQSYTKQNKIMLINNILSEKCKDLFTLWKNIELSKTY